MSDPEVRDLLVEVGELVEQSILELQQAAHLALQLLQREGMRKGQWLMRSSANAKRYHDIAQPDILNQHCLHGPEWNVTIPGTLWQKKRDQSGKKCTQYSLAERSVVSGKSRIELEYISEACHVCQVKVDTSGKNICGIRYW